MKNKPLLLAGGLVLLTLVILSLRIQFNDGPEPASAALTEEEGGNRIRGIRDGSRVRTRATSDSADADIDSRRRDKPAPGELSERLKDAREKLHPTNVTSATELAGENRQSTVVTVGKVKDEPEELLPVVVRIVQDGTSTPIEGVKVTVDGLHSGVGGESRAHGGWRTDRDGPAPSGVTDKDGLVTLAAPFFWSEKVDVLGISFNTEHSDYAAHREFQYPVTGQVKDVGLKPGNTLNVRAWMMKDGEKHWMQGIKPELEGVESRLAWIDTRHPEGGTMATAKGIPGGEELSLLVRADIGNDTNGYSRPQKIKFPESGRNQLDVEVEINTGYTLRGRLSDNVPRPVANGLAVHNWMWGPGEDLAVKPSMHQTSNLIIQPDGTFVYNNCPEGSGEIIAVCDGYIASYRSPDAKPYNQNQIVTVNAETHDQEFILQMEAGGTLEMQVYGPEGLPVQGAQLMLWPNVYWANGFSTIYARNWQAVSDARGIATVKGLRAGRQHYVVQSDQYEMPIPQEAGASSSRAHTIEIVAGQTLQTSVTLQLKGTQVLGQTE